MSWLPFFDQQSLSAFSAQIVDHPQGAGRGGILCPKELEQKCRQDFNYVVIDGKTTGNCAVSSFAASAAAQGIKKKGLESKARKIACDWLDGHKHDKCWGGWTVRGTAEAVSQVAFDKWLQRLRLTDSWGDAAFLHGLGCSLNLDILLICQEKEQARLVGPSLMIGVDHDVTALVPIAMHGHHHFWALVPPAARPMEEVSISLAIAPDRILSNRGVEMVDDDPEFDCLESQEESLTNREREVQLCEALVSWDPFALPNEEVMVAMKCPGGLEVFFFQSELFEFFTWISALRNISENCSAGPCIPQGVLARARRFAIVQLSREEGGQQDCGLGDLINLHVGNACRYFKCFLQLDRTWIHIQNTSKLNGRWMRFRAFPAASKHWHHEAMIPCVELPRPNLFCDWRDISALRL